MNITTRKFLLGLSAPVLLVGGLLSLTQPAFSKNDQNNTPPGNNGTVKVHAADTDDEPVINNEPHVCSFHLHFFFADPYQAGDWQVKSWEPTGNGDQVLSGSYDTSTSGEYRTQVYALSNGHYRLEWDGRNDHNVKHKMFWVDCPPPTPVPSPTPVSSPAVSPAASPQASPAASPVATPVASPGASTPVVSPSSSPAASGNAASPAASPNASPAASPSASANPAASTSPNAVAVATPAASPGVGGNEVTTTAGTSSSSENSSSTNSGSNPAASPASQGEVLGATTLGGTGAARESVGYGLLTMGILTAILSLYGYRRAKLEA